jgi:Porin subfamily
MKMVKSLLLGSAAGLVAVAGAQAADLPVKAKPVQYVKICSLYGVGFYYIPGTDMCIKIGGWVRAEYAYSVNGSSVGVYSAGYLKNNFSNEQWWRIRGYITADSRSQTEYGTVRGYLAIGLSTNTVGFDSASNQFDANRAFIQWAGFTFGRAQSFFDFYAQAAVGYLGFIPNSDTGDGGKEVLGYTAQFGNGFSASIAAEMRRVEQIVATGVSVNSATGVVNIAAGSIQGGGGGQGAFGGFNAPDIVGNLRVDQAWGSAAITGALHNVNATYYAGPTTTATSAQAIAPGVELNGHPNDEWGWAVAAGLRLNAPFIGQGDYFQGMVTYTQGALRYIFQNQTGNYFLQNGQNIAYGVITDGVYGGSLASGNTTKIELTTAWLLNASYEHFWNPRWRTSLYGGYTEVKYNTLANAMLCSAQGDGTAGSFGTASVANAGCNNNWNQWWIGSRTQWNVTKDFYMGVDVAYTKIDGATSSTGLTPVTGATSPILPANTNTTIARTLSNEDNWMVRFRVHRDFYP